MQPPITKLKTFIFTALPCEAKPLIEHYKLKKDNTVQAFNIFRNTTTALTVTGIGKNAMAAGVAYTQALFQSTQNPILLNIGIAGHSKHPVGSLFLADKIGDADTSRLFYPPLVFTPPCRTHYVQTFAQPQLSYHFDYLCDMEAAAFYETAIRFTTGELISCLKIVSDNQEIPSCNIKPAMVSDLVSQHLPVIDTLITNTIKLTDNLTLQTINNYNQIINQYRLSVSEQIQAQKLLQRWSFLKDEQALTDLSSSTDNGKVFLQRIKQVLDEAEFIL